PARVALGVYDAEKFAIATELTGNLARERNRVYKLLVVIRTGFVSQNNDSCLHPQLKLRGQRHAEWKDRSAFNGTVIQTAGAGGKFKKGEKCKPIPPAIVSPQVDFQAGDEITDTA